MEKIKTDWGYVVDFGNAEGVGVSILIIKPREEIKPHYHKKTWEAEVILEGKGLVNNEPIKRGNSYVWKFNQVHGYLNNGKTDLKILCITHPPYDPDDDIMA